MRLKNWNRRIIALVLSFLMIVVPLDMSVFSAAPTQNEDQYIVTFKNQSTKENFVKNKKKNKKLKQDFDSQPSVAIELTDAEVAELAVDSDVLYIELDSEIEILSIGKPDKNDKAVSKMQKGTQEVPWGIADVVGTANLNKYDGKKVKVAVFDTGISNHEDLTISGGVSFVDYTKSYADDNGHGTHVAGTIAANNNRLGVIGVAPDAEIYAVKILNQNGGGNYSNIIAALEWAIDNEIDIINMSLGGNQYSMALHNAIQQTVNAGIIIVAAAGNKGAGDDTITYPAKYPEVVAVGAVNENYEVANFSSRGSELNIVAPGTSVLSTLNDGKYAVLSGTSMAAPHVTGALAALKSKNHKMTSLELINRIYMTATPLGDYNTYGHGFLNFAYAAGEIQGAFISVAVEDTPPYIDDNGIDAGEDQEAIMPDGDSTFDIKAFDIKINEYKKILKYYVQNIYDNGDIELSKEINNKLKDLIETDTELHQVPEYLNKYSKEESDSLSFDILLKGYYSTLSNELNRLENDYLNLINLYSNKIVGEGYPESNNEEEYDSLSIPGYDENTYTLLDASNVDGEVYVDTVDILGMENYDMLQDFEYPDVILPNYDITESVRYEISNNVIPPLEIESNLSQNGFYISDRKDYNSINSNHDTFYEGDTVLDQESVINNSIIGEENSIQAASTASITISNVTQNSITVNVTYPNSTAWGNLLDCYDWTTGVRTYYPNWVVNCTDAQYNVKNGTYTKTGLEAGRKYTFTMGYYQNSTWYYKEIHVFTTFRTPSVTVSNIGTTTATFSTVFPCSTSANNYLYFYDTQTYYNSPLTCDWVNDVPRVPASGPNTRDGTYNLTNLVPNTTYKVRIAYYRDDINQWQETVKTFTTSAYSGTTTINSSGKVSYTVPGYMSSKITNTLINNVDASFTAMEDLVGGQSSYGSTFNIKSTREFTTPIIATAGSPIKYNEGFLNEHLLYLSYYNNTMVHAILHEMGHNFDSYRWNFEPEFCAELKTAYILDTKGYRVTLGTYTYSGTGDGVGSIRYMYKSHPGGRGYDYCIANNVYDSSALVYRFLKIKDVIGWEPFKQTFRYFNALDSGSVPTTNIGKLNLFLTKLRDYSTNKTDVIAMFTSQEKSIYQSKFGGTIAYAADTVTVTAISAGTSKDVSLSAGQYAVYKFTPTVTGEYDIYTGPYGGTGSSNDTYLELYSDQALTNRIAYNDDYNGTTFSKISYTFTANVSYYIKLRPYNATSGSVHARISVIQNIPVTTLNLNTPTTVTITSGVRQEVRFTAPAAGTYKFESSNRGSLDPTAYTAAGSSGTTVNDDSGPDGRNYMFTQTLSAGQTYVYYSGVYANSNVNGSYVIRVVPADSISVSIDSQLFAGFTDPNFDPDNIYAGSSDNTDDVNTAFVAETVTIIKAGEVIIVTLAFLATPAGQALIQEATNILVNGVKVTVDALGKAINTIGSALENIASRAWNWLMKPKTLIDSGAIPAIKAKDLPKEQQSNIYFHATTYENALKIFNTGTMIPSGLEKRVFAWKLFPSDEALKNSGAASYEVVIMFESNAAFETDDGVALKYQIYNPVRTYFMNQTITVKNVKIVKP